jgi:hypothetical protein
MLRGLPADLLRRLRAYANREGLGQRDAAVTLIDAGLRAHERAVQARCPCCNDTGRCTYADGSSHACPTCAPSWRTAGHARRRGGGVMDGGVMDAEEGVER